MKQIFLSLSFMITVGLTTVFASDSTYVNYKTKQSFEKEFAGAESVKWKDLGDYQMASFVLYGYQVEAYFTTSGELEGSARDIPFYQLPLAVIRSLDKRFTGACFTDVHEVSNIEGISYWLTVKTQNKCYRVKTAPSGNLLQVNKMRSDAVRMENK
jgi:hypothetical protein